MTVGSILQVKGARVETITAATLVSAAVQRMAMLGIGALVVSEDGRAVEGVFGERDVVRGLANQGNRLLGLTVGEVMTRAVPVCSPGDSVASAMGEMTRSRNRHLPVVDGTGLCGLISLGDLVKQRLEDMELETLVLRDMRRSGS